MMNSINNKKTLIGRLEYIDLPGFHLRNIIAKIDTGAYRGALHTDYVREFVDHGKKKIEFRLLDENHPEFKDILYTLDNFEVKKVKSSSGECEMRYVIPVTIVLKNRSLRVKLSLSDRKSMRYPILLGRKFIKNHFIIDASKTFTD